VVRLNNLENKNSTQMKRNFYYFKPAGLLCVLLFFLSTFAYGQYCYLGTDSEELQTFLHSTTLLVLSGDEEFDKKMEEGFKEYWKVTPYKVVKESELPEYIKNPAYSIFVPLLIRVDMQSSTTTLMKPRGNSFYDHSRYWLALYNGGKKSIGKFTSYDEIAYAPFDIYGTETSAEESYFRIPYMIKNINDAVVMVKEKSLVGRRGAIIKSLVSEYNSKAPLLKNKTLLINEDLLSSKIDSKPVFDVELLKLYPYKYKVAKQSEIESLIASKDKNYCYFTTAIDYAKQFFVFDIENQSVAYTIIPGSGIQIEARDIIELTNAIKK
jgi:hypothetical protein